jgi:hypothetical protein
MILLAPVGTMEEVLQWLKGLQADGCVTVSEAHVVQSGAEAHEAFGRPDGGGALLDPRKINVFLGEVQAATESDDGKEGLAL